MISIDRIIKLAVFLTALILWSKPTISASLQQWLLFFLFFFFTDYNDLTKNSDWTIKKKPIDEFLSADSDDLLSCSSKTCDPQRQIVNNATSISDAGCLKARKRRRIYSRFLGFVQYERDEYSGLCFESLSNTYSQFISHQSINKFKNQIVREKKMATKELSKMEVLVGNCFRVTQVVGFQRQRAIFMAQRLR